MLVLGKVFLAGVETKTTLQIKTTLFHFVMAQHTSFSQACCPKFETTTYKVGPYQLLMEL